VTIVRKTTGNPTGPTDGTVVYDNTGTSYTDTGLVAGVTYYYMAYSRDLVVNYSSGVGITASLLDTSPPSAISNLTVSADAARSVILNWTAVGEDGMVGTAASYDVRYSTSSITSANFSAATAVGSVSAPKVSGASETLTLSGLNGGVTYYFAIRVIDKNGNISSISNIVTKKTYVTSDLSKDYSVNSVDFGIMMSYWNATTRPAADTNQDGIVNSVDLGIMMSQWAPVY
jgi:hypothetical protein